MGNERELNNWGSPAPPQQMVFEPAAAFKEIHADEEESDSDRSGDGWQSARSASARRPRAEEEEDDQDNGSMTKRQRLAETSRRTSRLPSSEDTLVSGTEEVGHSIYTWCAW